MNLRFTKMHGLGNDFMVIDGVNQTIHLNAHDIQRLSQRETGVGFDQCLIIEPSPQPHIDFFYRIFNANGDSVGQCGNGARAIARFIQHYGLSNKKILTVATQTTQLKLILNEDESVTVEMGKPNLNPVHIPMHASQQKDTYLISLENSAVQAHALSIGNPHAVLLVESLEHAPVEILGKKLCEHPIFPEQANIGFLNIISPHKVALRVYERGCGETKACGSGAVAAVAAGRLFHQLEASVEVLLTGGRLKVDWPDIEGPIFLTGPACFIFEGCLMG